MARVGGASGSAVRYNGAAMYRLLATLLLLVGILSTVPEVHASDTAERYRLQEEMQRLAQRNAWQGVERTYSRLVALNLPLSPKDHLLASQAAQRRGETLGALERLELAVAAKPSEDAADDPFWQEAKQNLETLRARYGRVEISVVPPRLPALVRYDPPFAVQEREAIARAREQLSETRAYSGLLPVGRYMVDGMIFEVQAHGEPLALHVAPPDGAPAK